VPSNRTYIVTPSTIGLTRSPPGVIAVAKMAMPRMICRRAPDRSRDDTMFTRDRPNSRIGNSMISPNTRNIVVTKSKYGPAARFATSTSSVNASRNWVAGARTK